MQEPLSSPDAPVTPASDDAPGPILPAVQDNAAAPDVASLSRPRPPLPDRHEQARAGGGGDRRVTGDRLRAGPGCRAG